VVSYSELMDTLKGRDDSWPRDLYKEVHPEPHTMTCTANLSAWTNCTVGQTFEQYSRIDYILAFDSVDNAGVRSVKLESATRSDPQSTGGHGLGGDLGDALSDHPLFTVTSDVTQDLTALIVVLSVLGVLLLASSVLAWLVYTHRVTIPVPPIVSVYWRQACILTRKNWLISTRNRRALLLQVLVPVVFLSMLFALQYALASNQRLSEAVSVRRHSFSEPIPTIPRCVVGPDQSSCYSFGYTPSGDPLIDEIMDEGACVRARHCTGCLVMAPHACVLFCFNSSL